MILALLYLAPSHSLLGENERARYDSYLYTFYVHVQALFQICLVENS